jgi:hypothetical protein
MLPGLRDVIGELRAQKVVHLRTECFFDAQRHIGCQSRRVKLEVLRLAPEA